MKERPPETPTSLHPNNQYLLARIARLGLPARALDFGCGNGALVAAGRAAGLNVYGAETYYDGHRSEDASLARTWGCDETIVRRIDDGRLPFEDQYFDIVVHNQVFEHVKDLTRAAGEIHRVLKPGGIMVGIFPTQGVLREPHLGLPCVHWFRPGFFRSVWVKGTRMLGFGFAFWGTESDWFQRALPFLDEHVCYRSRKEIISTLNNAFDLKWIEPEWLGYRVPTLKWMLSVPAGKICAHGFCRVMFGVVVEATSRNRFAQQTVLDSVRPERLRCGTGV